MKSSIVIEGVLDVLQGGAETAAMIFDSMFVLGKAESMRRISRYTKQPLEFKTSWKESFKEHQKFHNLLNYLAKEGLIEKKGAARKSIWAITKKGKSSVEKMREMNTWSVSTANFKSDGGATATFKIVMYDIPAFEPNRKRLWLREALANLGFKMLQKSVWAGKKNIPKEFLEELRERKMLKYLQILEVAKRGTLRDIL